MVKKDLKDKLLRPIIIDNMKEIQVDDINIIREVLFIFNRRGNRVYFN